MIRDVTARDISQLRAIYERRGFQYDFPDLAGGNDFVLERAATEGEQIVSAVAARKTVELYFFSDPDWRTPAWRLAVLKELHEDVRKGLAARGFLDAHAWIPPEMSSFGKRLVRSFGWQRSTWPCYVRSTNG